jgi:hypothetical protein
VNQLEREHVDHLVQYIPDECHRRRFAVQDVRRDAPGGPHRKVRRRVVAELRIGRDGRLHVPGQVDLRHHSDATPGGVRDQISQLRLGVEAAVPHAVELGPGQAHTGGCANRADLGQQRIFLHLEAPALVIGQVQVQGVELVQ